MTRRTIAAAIALALVGCGGGGSGADGGTTPPPIVGSSHLAVTSSGPAEPVPGGRATAIDVVVSNTGTAASADVTVTSTLDASLTRMGATCTATAGAVCPATLADPVRLPSLPASGSVTLHVTLTPGYNLSGILTSKFHFASTDLPGGQQDSTADIHVTSAYVHVEETAPQGPVPLGGVAVFTTTITNPGPDSAPDLQLSHQLESTMAIGSVTCQAQGATPCPAVLGEQVTIPNLGVGDKLIFSVPVTVQSIASGRAVAVARLQRDGLPIDRYNEVIASAFVYAGPAPTQNAVHIVSDPGEGIGGGLTYDFISANSDISLTSNGSTFDLLISADKSWHGQFRLPAALATIQPGAYTNLPQTASDFTTTPAGSLSVSGGEYACGQPIGGSSSQGPSSLIIDSVTYTGATVSAIDFRFDQVCDSNPAHLRGTVHWTAADTTKPPGPWSTIPADLWQPPVGATPAMGNYVYLQSEIGDFVGNYFFTDYDHTYGYTQANAIIGVSESAGHLTLTLTGDEQWAGNFSVMTGQSRIDTGLYPALLDPPLNNTAVGGFVWFGDGRHCAGSTSWVAIDSVRYSGNELTALDARFGQLCDYHFVPLHGKIHWDNSDTTRPPPPVTPVPPDLWQPAAGATPSQGDYVYLQSIGDDGKVYESISNSVFTKIDPWSQELHVGAAADINGDFQAMNSIAQLQVGYYPNATRWPFGNPTKGSMDFQGLGFGCNTVAGWFAVDRIDIVNGTVQSLDLRFEERCDGYPLTLHGKIHVGP